jgi:hypothetical protein
MKIEQALNCVQQTRALIYSTQNVTFEPDNIYGSFDLLIF